MKQLPSKLMDQKHGRDLLELMKAILPQSAVSRMIGGRKSTYSRQSWVQLSTTLDQAPSDESWGIRDFYVFIAQCPAFCNKCTSETYCSECMPNYSIKGGMCIETPNFTQVEQSFFDSLFSWLNDWVLSGNYVGFHVSECGGKSIVGGFNVIGKFGVAQKKYKLLSHKRVKFQVQLYKIDSWDNEFIFIQIDGVEVWKQQWTLQTGGSNICGQSNQNDHIQYVEQSIPTNQQILDQHSYQIQMRKQIKNPGGSEMNVLYFSHK